MLTHTAALRARCAVLVAVNGRKEDELLRLEGERIDRRSLLEKALLQGSRRNQQRGNALLALSGGSSDALDASGEIDELKASLSAAERAVKDARCVREKIPSSQIFHQFKFSLSFKILLPSKNHALSLPLAPPASLLPPVEPCARGTATCASWPRT